MQGLSLTLSRFALQITMFVMVGSVCAQTRLDLIAGWNLMGNSSASPIDVATTLGDSSTINSVWTWNTTASRWAFYAPSMTSAALATYAQSNGYDVLTSISSKKGFWVNAKTAFLISLQDNSGTLPTIAAGWNLVTNGNNVSPVAFSASQTNAHINSIWAWDAPLSRWYFYAPSLDATGTLDGYIDSKGYLSFGKSGMNLGNGVGFWVNGAGVRSVEMKVQVTVPTNTPSADSIWLRTGITFDVNPQDVVMRKVSSAPDVWQASVSAPEGTILRYSYRRNGDWGKMETPPSRIYAVASHETLVTSNGAINDAIAQWQDLPIVGNSTGAVQGVVTSSSGSPLMGIRVSAGPHQTLTRWDGTYVIRGVPSGGNEVSFQADNGEFGSSRSSLSISSTETTTFNTSMKPASTVNVTFQVTVPIDTQSGAKPRLYGDSFRLGMVPYFQYGGTDPTRTIDMTHVSGRTWSFTATLGVGSCVNYTYTLGYSSLNNERDASGNPVVRSLCVPGEIITTDTVATWKAPWQVPVTFNAIAPTGSTETLYMTTDDWGNMPIKMWPTGADTATYVLYTNQNTPIKYRFLRNGDRNLGLEIVPPADQDPPLFRNINSGIAGTAVSDQITAWRHQPREIALTTVVSDKAQTISPRASGSFQTGVEFWDYWRTNWRPFVKSSISRIKSKNVQWAQIASVWDIRNIDSPTTEQGFNSFATEDLGTL